MAELKEFLIEWCIRFLENRDSLRREILSIGEKTEAGFSINYKAGTKQFFIGRRLDKEMLVLPQNIPTGFFIFNNKENRKALVQNWDIASKMKNTMLYFINPFSNSEKVWVINPYVHAMICDPDSLELGIKAMSEMVDDLNEKDAEKQLE